MASYFILKLTEKAKMYGDAAIGIVSSFGIAGGVILASLSKGFNVDLFSYLFWQYPLYQQSGSVLVAGAVSARVVGHYIAV